MPVLLFSVIAHEIAHGYAALKQGDTTALDAGRLTWNPIKHIDPFFTILLPLMMLTGSSIIGRSVVFGGAKPVPVDPRNFRNLRRGDIIVSLAGVFVNLLIALGCAIAIVVVGLGGQAIPALAVSIGILQTMLAIGVILNFGLISFNLLPIPPLDGSHVMKYLLPRPLAVRYVQYGRYGILILIALLLVGQKVLAAWFTPAGMAIDKILDVTSRFMMPWALEYLK